MLKKNSKFRTKYKPTKAASGVFLMLLHALAMSVLYVLNKELNQTLHPFQVAFLYKFTILIVILPWCFYGDIRKNLKTRRMSTHIARGVFSLLGSVCFNMAVKTLPVASTAAITYLDHILVILIGIFYFKEKLNINKIVMIVFCFIGALLIIKPGFAAFNKDYVYLLLAVVFWALNCTVIKMLGSTERSKAQLFYMMLFSSMISFPFALHEWEPVEMWHIKFVLGLALCYLIHAVAFFKAFKYADISTVMPFDYSRLIFTAILGYLVYNELPEQYSAIGYLLIITGGVFYIIKNSKKDKNKKIDQNKKDQLEAEYEQV
jgi:drug/metabolite transporter (DMT)-like permease